MITRLMLLRCHNVNESQNSTVLTRSGAAPFVQGDPIEARPQRWSEEDGASHYAWLLEGMKVEDLRKLEAFASQDERAGVSLHTAPDGVDAALRSLGLVRH